MALIALFKILFSLITLPIGSFYIASFISFSETIWLISKGKGKSQLLMSCRSTQYIPKKNLSISIFVFSLLLFVYQSCSIQQSTGRWGSPNVSPAALLLHFNKYQRSQLYNLVESKVVFFRNQCQLFLFSFYIIFLSLFFKAIKFQQ